MNFTKLFSALTRWSLYVSFFLVPLFFLPWTTDALEINKQMLLVILTLLSLVSWLGSMVMTKKLSFRSGWINLLPALFLVAVLVSSIFSLSGYQTWVGQASQEYTSFLTITMLVLGFYVTLNTANTAAVQRHLLCAILSSAALSGIIGLLSMFNIFHLPFAFAAGNGFNTVGTVNGLATFLSVAMFIGLAAWLVSGKGKEQVIPQGTCGVIMRVAIILVTLSAVITSVAVDFWVLWVINIIGVLLLSAFGFLQSDSFPESRRFALPLFILLVSVLLIFVRTPLALNLPVVVSPSYSSSWNISKDVLSEGIPRLLLGSGPGTFAFDYSKYRTNDVNGTIFWNLSFDRSKSHAITALATYGVVGTVLWLLVMLAVASLSLARLLTDRDSEAWKMTYVTFSGWAVLFVSHLVYSSNLTLSFLLWGLTGLLAAQAVKGVKETDFARSPRMGLGFSFAFVVVAVGVLGTLFVTGNRYAAEVAFAKAVLLDQSGGDMKEVINELGVAVSHNSLSDVYYRNLSSALLVQARNEIASAGTTELTADQRTTVSNYVSAAVNASKRATDIEPNNVSNWVVRGAIYRDVMSFVTNAEDFAAATFQQANILEPGNPSHLVNLGRIYLAVADRATQLKSAENAELAATAAKSETDQLASAEQAFIVGIQLKPDYAPAHYYLAATYERQGRLQDAVTRLAAVRNTAPNDIGLGFQLAMLYLRVENYDAARVELERVVALSPQYSNALWFLASLYEIKGEQQKAIAAVQIVANLNPNNQAVTSRLSRLQAGETTTRIPGPVEDTAGTATAVDAGEVVQEGDVVPEGEEGGVVTEDTGNE